MRFLRNGFLTLPIPLVFARSGNKLNPNNSQHTQSGIAMLEAVIFLSLALVIVIPVLVFVLVPKFMATGLNEKIVIGFESKAVSTNDLAELSMEGLTTPRDFGAKQTVVQATVDRLEKLTALPAGTFCGAVLTAQVDQAGNVSAPQLDSSFTSFGPGGAGCQTIADVPANAINSFLSSVDLRQPGVQTGFTVFSGNVYSRMRSTTVKANNKGLAP